MQRILVVEDSRESFELIRRTLDTSYELVWAQNIFQAQGALRTSSFGLILLDLHLPDGDGLGLCSMLNADESITQAPIFILSARTSVPEKLMAFTVGADDFITKPFHPEELKARIDGKLRKRTEKQAHASVIEVGGIRLDQMTHQVTVETDETPLAIDLTSLEFRLLSFFIRSRNRAVSRNEILDEVWGKDCHVFSRNVDTHVSKIKKKLGHYGDYLTSEHGIGYRFDVPVSTPFQSGQALFSGAVQ